MRRACSFAILLAACGPSADSGDASSCDMYESEPSGAAVEINVRNGTGSPWFFHSAGCFAAPIVDIFPPNESSPLLHEDPCSQSCQAMIDNGSCASECPNCGPPQAGRLDPGTVATTAFAGRLPREVELVDACAPEAECPSTCVRGEQAPAGMYFFAVTLFRSCAGTCECEDTNDSAACGIYGELELLEPVVVSNLLDYPSLTTVDLVITE